jgi:hypothetical protein
MPRRRTLVLAVSAALAGCALLAGFYFYAGWYGFNVVARRGASVWVAIAPTDPRLSESMRVALREVVPPVQPGRFDWERRAEGLETTELPAMIDQQEVDRLLLVRLDPTKYSFEVKNLPAGDHDLGAWMKRLHAVAVINGS